MYSCTSEDGGAFAFHYVSGDGLDIVEHRGSVHVQDGAVRGISVTRDSSLEEATTDPVRLSVDDSVVVNVCFSDGLKGSATFTKSFVMMLINASENSADGFTVSFRDCRYQFLVNTDVPSESNADSALDGAVRYFEPMDAHSACFEAPNRTALAEDLEKMDFRYRPERWESIQRRRRHEFRAESLGPESERGSM
jgi:hypothetical protein